MRYWILEGFLEKNRSMSRISINKFPFQIGRQGGLSLTLPSAKASRIHAEILEEQGVLYLKDLDSTNGSYINTDRISGQKELNHGDIVHFADCEFRVMSIESDEALTSNGSEQTVMFQMDTLPTEIPSGVQYLLELLDKKMVQSCFQAIVVGDNADLYGFEVLGRGRHPQLPESPYELFAIAESIGEAVRLSEILREKGLDTASAFSPQRYFLNIHPEELKDYDRLLSSFEKLRKNYPSIPLVFEVHEQAVTNLQHMRQVKQDLAELKIELAYDDFGAGQARILELVEVPPDYLKFDMAWIRDIDTAQQARIDLITFLVEVAKKMGSKTLAECVETAAEIASCKKIGFELYQGNYFARPCPSPSY